MKNKTNIKLCFLIILIFKGVFNLKWQNIDHLLEIYFKDIQWWPKLLETSIFTS